MGPSPHSNVCDCRSVLATTWRQQSEDYAQVSRIGEPSKRYQAAVLRGCIGPTGLEVYSGLPFVGAGDRDDTVKILELLEGYRKTP